jgi:hypothetical protein
MLLNGQSAVAPPRVDNRPRTAVLKSRAMEVGAVPRALPAGGMTMESHVVAKGEVEIRIGSTVLTADEAEIHYGGPSEPDDVELRGNVHLKAVLDVK